MGTHEEREREADGEAMPSVKPPDAHPSEETPVEEVEIPAEKRRFDTPPGAEQTAG